MLLQSYIFKVTNWEPISFKPSLMVFLFFCCRCKKRCFSGIIAIFSLLALISTCFSLYLSSTRLYNSPLIKTYKELNYNSRAEWICYYAVLGTILGITIGSILISLTSCLSAKYTFKPSHKLHSVYRFLITPASIVLAILAIFVGGFLLAFTVV